MTVSSLFPFPAELAALPRDRAAVIEASAGTGKTYLIEHLVVDRLVRGDARIDEMLVVTFTERAAAELVRRVRALIRRVLRNDATVDDGAAPHVWAIDAAARERLEAALRALDVAPISTIHAFCQRVLTEHAFASGRLLAQSQVESRTAFTAAFDEVIRSRLDGEPATLLSTWLLAGSDVVAMEALLYNARRLRCEWETLYDPARIARAAEAFAAPPLKDGLAAVVRAISNKATQKAIASRLEDLYAMAQPLPRAPSPGDAARGSGRADQKDEGPVRLPAAARPSARREGEAGHRPAARGASRSSPRRRFRSRPRSRSASARSIEERLQARKRAAGLYDFDDMLALVDEALRGPRGGELAASLRRRYRLAVIDEFQDTDPVQWQIFRTIFLDAAPTRGRSTWSAIRSRRSTASAAPTSAPTSSARDAIADRRRRPSRWSATSARPRR